MNIHDNEILSLHGSQKYLVNIFYNIRYSRFTMIVVFEEILIKHAVSWLF